MKIAVYAVALNELKHLRRWLDSAAEADYILLADTGSTDGTYEEAFAMKQRMLTPFALHSISVTPWRFDDARNAALALLPADIDYCISLDLDEVLVPGWRAELEKATTTRPRYTYTWSWVDGNPGLQFQGDHIHARRGYRWEHPVHEVVTPFGITETQENLALEIHHLPDSSKPRDYLPLLALSVQEDPDDDRNAFYYARELYFRGKHPEAAREFRRHLHLPRAKWLPERAASYRYLSICDPDQRLEWLNRAVAEDPSRREGWVMLASYHYDKQEWAESLNAIGKALAITEKPLDYLCEPWAWNEYPWDLGAHAAYRLGRHNVAFEYGSVAARLAPQNERVVGNLDFYTQGI